ncbi:hypothetical protein MPH_13106 [Macrophomina phaseolina MS6]|uniref:Uncharacterized protein n=2 Tax=Macrophomina phaseolina TaxID=35725 RepID=K2RIG6_MACPH|nr:hypothetical protein MPH_13106 [Macrophomina phaseolina MS6]
MATSSISVYQQQATKLLSRKSVVLGIPLAAGSIILFLQWRKRKSLKPKPKSQHKKQESEEIRTTATSNGKATTHSSSNGSLVEKTADTAETAPASAQNGSATASVAAAPADSIPTPDFSGEVLTKPGEPTPAAASPASPQNPSATPASTVTDLSATTAAPRPKHVQEDEEGPGGLGFAYAKRPRLGRGRSSEKFQSYEPLRRTSAEKREELEKQKIKEEDDRAAAAAVAAFSPVVATAPSVAVVQTESAPALAPKEEEVLPPQAAPEAAILAAAEKEGISPEDPIAAAEATDAFAVKVNGWHHDDDGHKLADQPIRDSRRPSIIATTEIHSTSEPAPVGLSPHGTSPLGQPDPFSRRPSVITTISAEPPIDEEEEEIDWAPESRRESATVETTIEVKDGPLPRNGEDEPPVFETTISGPIPVSAQPAPDAIDEQEPAALDAPPSLASRAVDAGVRDGEASMRTDSPLSSKPVVVAAATGFPAPHSAVVEEVREVVERAPLAHLPGMGIPNSA